MTDTPTDGQIGRQRDKIDKGDENEYIVYYVLNSSSWIIYSCCAMDEILVTLFHHWEFLPPEKRDQQVLDKTLPKAKACMDYIEKTLEGREYILGKE